MPICLKWRFECDGQSSILVRRGILSKSTSGLLLVGKIDGSISALDEDSGKILWTFDSGSPLISTSQDATSEVQVFPGIDGSIYVLHDEKSPKLEVRKPICGGRGLTLVSL